jgi:hypothetical protein
MDPDNGILSADSADLDLDPLGSHLPRINLALSQRSDSPGQSFSVVSIPICIRVLLFNDVNLVCFVLGFFVKTSGFYIGYNRATGFNEETQDEANKVHVIEKENPYADWYGYNGEGLSWRVAALGEGEVYSWEMGSQRVKVKVSRISGKNAIVWVHGGNSEDEPSEDEPAKCNEKPTRSFVLKSGTRKTCANVSSKKGSSRKKFCGVTTDTRNKKVHQFCPKSCGEVGVGACA